MAGKFYGVIVRTQPIYRLAVLILVVFSSPGQKKDAEGFECIETAGQQLTPIALGNSS
jgi:hypothetical protein